MIQGSQSRSMTVVAIMMLFGVSLGVSLSTILWRLSVYRDWDLKPIIRLLRRKKRMAAKQDAAIDLAMRILKL